jgi:aryl-alcohol dehydrogenase-like predicted oxidoreductase
MSHSIETAEIGSTGLRVTRLGLGGAPMSAFMYDVDESEAVALISRASGSPGSAWEVRR